jgi:hypothetical protein
MVDLSARNFRFRVTIKTVNKSKDLSAGYNEPYSTLLTTWAVVDDKGGATRSFTDGKMVIFDRVDFYMRWRNAFSVIDKDTIFEFDGKRYKYQDKSFVNGEKHIIKYEMIGQ